MRQQGNTYAGNLAAVIDHQRVDLASGTAEPAASASILDAWDVAAALNQVLAEHGDDPTWRNVLLDPADLAEYKVS
jgi:hypothetical protein